ncbi:MAG TPA: transglycosylase SLT domain-containing protein [Clostridium sp.]
MSDELALKIPITADAAGFSSAMQGVKESASGALGGVKSHLADVKLAFGAIGIAAGGYLVSAVNSAAKAEVSTTRLNKMLQNQGMSFQSAKKDVNEFTSGITKMSIYSGEDARDALANLTQKGLSYGESLHSSTALTNLAAGANINLTSASTLLSQAHNGQYMRLERLGIVTKEQVKNGLTYEQTLGLINKRFGGTAAAQMETYTGQQAMLAKSFASVKVAIGTALLPVLTELTKHTNEALQPVIAFIKGHSQLAAGILVTIAAVGGLVGGFAVLAKVSEVLGPGVKIITGLISGISWPILAVIATFTLFTLAYTKNFGGFKTFIDGVFKGALSIFNAFKAAISGGDVGKELSSSFGKNTGQIKVVIQGIVDAVKVFVAILTGNFKSATKIIDMWGDGSDETMGKVVKTVAKVALTIRDVVTSIVSFVKAHMPQIKAVISDVFNGIKTIWNSVLLPLLKIMINNLGVIISFVVAHWPQIKDTIEAVFNGIKVVWDKVLKPTLAFLITGIKAVVDWISTNWPLIQQTVTTVFSNVKKTIKVAMVVIQSVIEAAMTVLKPIWTLAWNVIKNVIGPIFNLIKDIISTAMKIVGDVIKLAMNLINGNWSGAWKSLCNIAKDIFGGMKKIVNDQFAIIGGLFKGVATTALGWGKDLVQSIINGIKSKAAAIGNGAMDIVNLVIKKFKEGFGIHSPSTVFHGFGFNLIQGLMNGLSSTNLKSFTGNMIKSIKSSFSNGTGEISSAFQGMLGGANGILDGAEGLLGKLGISIGGTGGASGSVLDMIKKAIGITGTDPSNLNALATIAMHESGGSQTVQNNWDSNAKAGIPSAGLFQMIQPTFDEHKLPGHNNRLNGVDSAISAIRYMISRYGSVNNVPGIKSLKRGGAYVGYANGTFNALGGLSIKGEHGPELSWSNSGDKIIDAQNTKALLNIPAVLQKLTESIDKINTNNKATNNTGGDYKLADKIYINNDMDIKKVAEQFEFYRKAYAKGRGGN